MIHYEKMILARELVIDLRKRTIVVAEDQALGHLLNLLDWVIENGDRIQGVDSILRHFPGAKAAVTTESGARHERRSSVGTSRGISGGPGRKTSDK